MKHFIFILLFLFAFATISLAESNGLLAELSTELKRVRSLPAESEVSSSCPDNLDSLLGIKWSAVKDALGYPDYYGEGATYFFTSAKRSKYVTGGGFPELTFYINGDGKGDGVVRKVTCHYSR